MPMGNKLCGLGSLRRRSSKRKRKTSNNHSSPTESTQNVHSDPQPSESGSTLSEVQPDSQPSESASTQSEVQPNPQRSESASTQSEVQPNPQPSESGLPPGDWWNPDYLRCDEKRSAQQILEDVGEQDITHLLIKYKLPSSLKDIAPNLTHLSLSELEDCSQLDSLRELMELKALHLVRTDFSSGLPSVIGELKSLTELSLVNCKLTGLPDNFRELKELKVLYLRNVDFSNGLPSVIGELKSLTELRIYFGNLTDLPENMKHLEKLKILDLRVNDFSNRIPEVITQLTSLTELSLMECNLTILPKGFGNLEKLEKLNLSGNDFSKGMPDDIAKLVSLNYLCLPRCSLTDLPSSLDNLKTLSFLDLRANKLAKIPPVIYELEKLEKLLLSENSELVKMDEGILQLKKLRIILLDGTSLPPPLSDVALQGVEMIKKYFSDLARNAVVSTIPVAIIGDARAGKTSIRKSLITRKRELIHRSSSKENMTEVFEVEPLELKASKVNLIDFGRQDIYHVAYQLALKETCVPLLVVHMGKYKDLLEKARREEQPMKRHIKEEEATKRLCMEWLCHLYVAQPTLGKPMLALTHIDKCRDEFEVLKGTLLQKSGEIQEKWLEREKNWLEKEKERFKGTTEEDDVKSERISCIKMMEFSDKDIFEFTDETDSSHIEELRTRIEERCVGKIPQNWKDVEDELKKLDEEPYIELSDVTKKFCECTDILKYLHNTGAILWFDQKEELKNYVFHRTKAVTDMVALLLSPDKVMETECEGFFYKEAIGEAEHRQFLRNLTGTPGMIDEAFLSHQVKTKTEFQFPIANHLLMHFHIIHGPIDLKDDMTSRTVYLVPSIIEKSMDESWKTSGQLQLRFDLIFNGLPLPKQVYHLMTVVVLNLKKEREYVEAYSNGAKVVREDYYTTYFVHDYDHQKVTVQVSTNVARLKESWDRLKSTTTALKSWLKKEWSACLVELETYCAHCLFLKDSDAGSQAKPKWYKTNKTDPQLLDTRRCSKTSAKVPIAFLMPCSVPNEQQIETLEGYLTTWQS